MARSRNIKPGFFKNEDLAECTVWARLLFAGLWTLADREGRLEDRPKRIKGELFAFDSIEVAPLLEELAAHGFIYRYQCAGIAVLQILKFRKHQNPHHREPGSVFASPQSLGLLPYAIDAEPEADGSSDDGEASDKPGASPGLTPPISDLLGGSNRAVSGALIPDTGEIPEEANASSSSAEPTEAGQKRGRTPNTPFEEIVGLYHEVLPELPKVRVMDDERKKLMAGLWKFVLTSKKSDGTPRATNEAEALLWVRGYFERTRDNDFVMNRTARSEEHKNWRANLDYLCTSRGMKQVIEKTEAAA